MRPGGREGQIGVAAVFESVQAPVVERVEDQLAGKAQQVKGAWPVLGDERPGGGEVLAWIRSSASSSARYSSLPCGALLQRLERGEQVALLILRAPGLPELVAALVAQRGEAVTVGVLGVVAQPGGRLHDVGVRIVDDPAFAIRHGTPLSEGIIPGWPVMCPLGVAVTAIDLTPRQIGGGGRRYALGAMDLRDRPQDLAFRDEVRRFLETHNVGEFAELGGRGGSGDETFGFETRLRWEKVLAEGGWTCLGWPTEHGGRGATMTEQVIFNEEYVRAAAPGRVSILGEGLLGPTLIHYGTQKQKDRFLPPIRSGSELWCQGYSELRRRQRPGQRQDAGGARRG